MDEEYVDFDLGGRTFKVSPEAIKGLVDVGEFLNKHLTGLGQICWSFAELDHAVSQMFEPLLDCTEEQVACILVENLSTRVSQITRLMYLESELPESFVEWIAQLLNRARNELANERNRFIHDRWGLTWNETTQSVTRFSNKPRTSKAQSRQRKTVTVHSEHPTTDAEMTRLVQRIETVTGALGAARRILATWRHSGQLSPLDPQWLPASKPNALGHRGAWLVSEHPEPPPPSSYEFG